MSDEVKIGGSFRDPAGFVFRRGDALLRQVNHSGREDYDRLVGSELYRTLTRDGLLIAHDEDGGEPLDAASAYKVIRPERVPFVSYPYEWCFSQLRDAALLTLEIQRRAIASGLSLKDASAYNVQFKDGRPVFIDTLSFEPYREGTPWVAYRQFCEHFLAPLAMMAWTDGRLNQLLRTNIDGVPLDLASRLLPWRTRLDLALGVHIHLHARMQSAHGGAGERPAGRPFSRRALLSLIDHLDGAIRRLRWRGGRSEWEGYEREHGYSEGAHRHKEELVAEAVERTGPATAWDLGANTGRFSRVVAARGVATVAFDLDPACVEANYREVRRRGETTLLPLWLDLRNPSPASGWRNAERASLLDRGPSDLVLALALIHHLAFAGNLPLGEIAALFSELGRALLVEFVPPDDPQVLRLRRTRAGVHHPYDRDHFERTFRRHFVIEDARELVDGGRFVYLMRRREP